MSTAQWGGLPVTLILAIFGVGFAFPLGVLLALGRRSKLPIMRAAGVVYIEIIRRRAADHRVVHGERDVRAVHARGA
ncbi:MAG: hypothetical protein R3E48_11140 [Burkholderiaceae bacterium]